MTGRAFGIEGPSRFAPGEDNPPTRTRRATSAMSDDTVLPFEFPAVGRKRVIGAFDDGRLTSDGGVVLLATVIAAAAR